jgi:hypothetical protein
MSCIKPLKYLIDEVVLLSPSMSEYDLIQKLQNVLDSDITANTTNICCTCSADSFAPY